jgi:hypothetical protein
MSTEQNEKRIVDPAARRETFARHLAIHGNQVAAYREAYPDATEVTARDNASSLSKDPAVIARVAELNLARLEQLKADTADLDALISNLATGKAAELVDADGQPIPLAELPSHVKAAIVSIEFEAGGQVKRLRFPDPLAAARLLAQLRGELIDRKDVTSGGRSLAEPRAVRPDLEGEVHRRLLGDDIEDGELVEEFDDGSDLL